MSGYTEVLQVLAAMVIFSMIMLNANHMIHRNTVMQVEGELEQEVVALAQEIIEEALTKSFDEVTHDAAAPPSLIPGGFTSSGALGPDAGESARTHFNDFDDYHDWSDTFVTEHGSFEISADVFYVDETTFDSTSDYSTFKKIVVTITNEHLRKSNNELIEYNLEFIRNYYAD